MFYLAYFITVDCYNCRLFGCQVHPILLSVTLDKQESEQVRSAAFMVLKKSHPSFTTLQLIAQSLRTEPSRQIKTLIFSSLVNLAKVKSDITEIRSTYVRRIQSAFCLLVTVCTILLKSKCETDRKTQTVTHTAL